MKERYPQNCTVLIHIGKCGGQTVRDGIENASRNAIDVTVHVTHPLYRDDLNYVIVARGPIARLRSAFNWRYKIVVEDGQQVDKFEGEAEVLKRYKTLQAIAEDLYDVDGNDNPQAQADILKIHHIKQHIAFYLEEILERCHPSQITAVLMQENLNQDIETVFGYQNELSVHHNPQKASTSTLSPRAEANLKRFFVKDFEMLNKLYCWGKIDKQVLLKAI